MHLTQVITKTSKTIGRSIDKIMSGEKYTVKLLDGTSQKCHIRHRPDGRWATWSIKFCEYWVPLDADNNAMGDIIVKPLIIKGKSNGSNAKSA
jgi:hypothetical protein